VAEKVLLERTHGDGGVTYRFADDGMPIYLWLLATQSGFREGEALRARPERGRAASTAV
jgi:predicted lipoprotein with Yx(FWY)xxD motif